METNPIDQKSKTEEKDLLLVHDRQENKLQVVTGVDEKGNLKTTSPKTALMEGSGIQVEKDSDLFSNFFKNFTSQLNDPTRFNFFKVAKEKVQDFVQKFDEYLKNPTLRMYDKLQIGKSEVFPPKPEKEEKKQSQEQTQQEKPATQKTEQKTYVDPDKINWDSISRLGVTKETLQKTGDLEKMLNGQQSSIPYKISGNIDGIQIREQDAYLSFRVKDGNVELQMQGMNMKPNFDKPYFGYTFTEQDQKQLLETGNLGKVVELKNFKSGENYPAYISLNEKTNTFQHWDAKNFRIGETLNGAPLSPEQQEKIKAGEAVFVRDMVKKGTENDKYSATVQVSAIKRGLEFIFPKSDKQSVEQKQGQEQGQNNSILADWKKARGGELYNDGVRIPFKLGDIELKEDQRLLLASDKRIEVLGLTDKEGKTYHAEVFVDHDKGKLGFKQLSPERVQELSSQIKPLEQHKDQVAVNNEGKITENTKSLQKVGEPVKPGQNKPTEDQQKKVDNKQDNKQKQSEDKKQKQSEDKKPAKSVKRKM